MGCIGYTIQFAAARHVLGSRNILHLVSLYADVRSIMTPSFAGQGACSGDWTAGVIEDTVIVPKDAAPGKYLLSWRWDAEETAQVWQNCADITITA